MNRQIFSNLVAIFRSLVRFLSVAQQSFEVEVDFSKSGLQIFLEWPKWNLVRFFLSVSIRGIVGSFLDPDKVVSVSDEIFTILQAKFFGNWSQVLGGESIFFTFGEICLSVIWLFYFRLVEGLARFSCMSAIHFLGLIFGIRPDLFGRVKIFEDPWPLA